MRVLRSSCRVCVPAPPPLFTAETSRGGAGVVCGRTSSLQMVASRMNRLALRRPESPKESGGSNNQGLIRLVARYYRCYYRGNCHLYGAVWLYGRVPYLGLAFACFCLPSPSPSSTPPPAAGPVVPSQGRVENTVAVAVRRARRLAGSATAERAEKETENRKSIAQYLPCSKQHGRSRKRRVFSTPSFRTLARPRCLDADPVPSHVTARSSKRAAAFGT